MPRCARAIRAASSRDESVVSGLLSRYPLTSEGYVALAANLFWSNWRSLTVLFLRIDDFLTQHPLVQRRSARPGRAAALGRRAVSAR